MKVKLQIGNSSDGTPVNSFLLDFRNDTFERPSTLIGRLPNDQAAGDIELTIAAGEYQWLRLMHPDYLLIPIYAGKYGHGPGDKAEPMKLKAGENEFSFRLAAKVKVRGRMVMDGTGAPMADAGVEGSMHCDSGSGPFARFAEEWSHADWGNTNARGQYELSLAAGRARVKFQEQGWLATTGSLRHRCSRGWIDGCARFCRRTHAESARRSAGSKRPAGAESCGAISGVDVDVRSSAGGRG